MSTTYRLYRESIQEFRLPDGSCMRVWREAVDGEPIRAKHDDDVSETIAQLVSSPNRYTLEDAALIILGTERVNAVEAKDAAGNGAVLYKDWP